MLSTRRTATEYRHTQRTWLMYPSTETLLLSAHFQLGVNSDSLLPVQRRIWTISSSEQPCVQTNALVLLFSGRQKMFLTQPYSPAPQTCQLFTRINPFWVWLCLALCDEWVRTIYAEQSTFNVFSNSWVGQGDRFLWNDQFLK